MSFYFAADLTELQGLEIRNPGFNIDIALVTSPGFYTYRLQDDSTLHSPPESVVADGVGSGRWALKPHRHTLVGGEYILQDTEQAIISGGQGIITVFELTGEARSSVEGKVTVGISGDVITATNVSGAQITIGLYSYIRR